MKNKKKQIVFFCATTPYVMIYKIAREFRKRNYETVLITISQRDKWDINWYKDGFDKIICSNFQIFKPTLKNSFNMLIRIPYLLKSIYEMKKLKPYAVFAVARPNYITALAMKFFKKYPLIYFPYDINSHFYEEFEDALKKGIKPYEINSERYCFENADGILHKGAPGELSFLNKKSMLGEPLKMTPLQICFHPYCSDEFTVPINKNKLRKKDNSIHLVWAGGLFSDPISMSFFSKFFKNILDQGIHIHLYIKTQHLSSNEDKFNLYKGLNSIWSHKNLHKEFSIDPKKLISEISKYDFGLWMDKFNSTKKDHLFYIGNKVSTYFEAGIPFIYPKQCRFLNNIMENYDLSFRITNNLNDLKNLKKDIINLDYEKIEKNILRARKDFNLNKQFPRLEMFIKKVIKRKNYYHNNFYK